MPFKVLQALTLLFLFWPQTALKTEYDKFRDETTVSTGQHSVNRKGFATLKVRAYYIQKGGSAKAAPEDLIIGLMFYSDSDRWQFTRDDHLIVLADGARIDLGVSAASDFRIDHEARARETLDYEVTPTQLQQIAKAAKLEMQLGSVEFKVSDKFRQEVKELNTAIASRP